MHIMYGQCILKLLRAHTIKAVNRSKWRPTALETRCKQWWTNCSLVRYCCWRMYASTSKRRRTTQSLPSRCGSTACPAALIAHYSLNSYLLMTTSTSHLYVRNKPQNGTRIHCGCHENADESWSNSLAVAQASLDLESVQSTLQMARQLEHACNMYTFLLQYCCWDILSATYVRHAEGVLPSNPSCPLPNMLASAKGKLGLSMSFSWIVPSRVLFPFFFLHLSI